MTETVTPIKSYVQYLLIGSRVVVLHVLCLVQIMLLLVSRLLRRLELQDLECFLPGHSCSDFFSHRQSFL